jgi:YD repeat-containing protein
MHHSCTRVLPAILFVVITITSLPGLKAQSISQKDYAKLVEVLPPSPNAAELTKFGGIPVGLSSGVPNVQVPVWTVQSRKLKVPVYLRYSSGGIKTDQIASRAGMGWVLEAGGVISRTVQGLADERATMVKPPPLNGPQQTILDFLLMITNTGVYDTQQDMFSFNFGEHSGTFVLDSSRNVHCLNKSNLRIQNLLGSPSPYSFKITDGKGIEYFFGDANATELTRKRQNLCGRIYDVYLPTAWYLNMIVDPGVDTISFHYNRHNYNYVTGLTQSVVKPAVQLMPMCGSNFVCPTGTESNNCLMWLETDGAILQEIRTSAFTTVTFRHQSRTDISGDSLVNKIRVFDRSSGSMVLAREFTFNYLSAGTDNTFANDYNNSPDLRSRSFLSSMEIGAGPGSAPQIYYFAYDRPESLPPRISFGQDHYGFFNGAAGNTSLIPTVTDPMMSDYFDTYAQANRSVNPAFAGRGLLNRIIYPTGGSDSLIYEGNDYWAEEPGPIPTGNKSVSVSSLVYRQLVTKSDTVRMPVLAGASSMLGTLTIEATVGDPQNPSPHDLAELKVYDQTTAQLLLSETYVQYTSKEISIGLVAGHLYKIECSAQAGIVEANMSATLKYQSGIPAMIKQNKPAGGMRVAKVLTRNNFTGATITKRYYYRTLAKPDSSSGRITNTLPNYIKIIDRVVECSQSVGGTVSCGDYYSILSSSVDNMQLYPGGPVVYTGVVEGWGEDFENGGVEYAFETAKDIPSANILNNGVNGGPVTNFSWRNGLEIYRNTFKKLPDGTKRSVQKIYNFYKDDVRGQWSFDNYIFEKNYELAYGVDAYTTRPFNGGLFKVNGNWTYKDSSRIVTFDDNNDSLVVTEKNFYDNASHLQLTRQRSKNSLLQEQLLINRYPQDKTAILNLSASAAQAIDSMISANEVEPLIEMERYSGGGLQLAVRNNNKYWTMGGRSFTAPADVEIKTGTAPKETRVVYTEYNARENLVTQAKAGDAPNTYLYDYNGIFPVAQVLNAGTDAIAYTSFEAEGKGLWAFAGSTVADNTAPTGKKAYLLTGNNITRTSLPSGAYVVSYWAKGGSVQVNGGGGTALRAFNGWTLYRHLLTAVTSVTVSGSGYLDELRLHPQGAQMVSYTYDPIYGINAQADAKGQVTKYEYDLFGRLKLIRDMDGKILKQMEYQYNVNL